MGLTRYNRNYVGTQFGGSLYSMVDPFYMLMLMENLGRDYIVWDKAASIDFISPGKGPVYAEFHVDDACSTRSVGRPPAAKVPAAIAGRDSRWRRRAGGAGRKTLYVRLKPQARQA
jgi:hypothetical protein